MDQNDMTRAPPVSQELIDYLEERFPPDPPDPQETCESLRVRAGEQRVIRRLKVMRQAGDESFG